MAKKKLTPTYLISEELLKLYSNMTKNVGINKVIPYLSLSQPMYIEPILGTPLFDELTSEIESGVVTKHNQALILKIAPALALWNDYLAIRGLGYTVTEKGITKEKSENSESINEKEMAEWKLDIKNQAEVASELLIKYLCKCRDTYPLWLPEDECLCDKYEPKSGTAKKPFKSLIYFPNSPQKGCGC